MKRPTTSHYHAHRVFKATHRYKIHGAVLRFLTGRPWPRRKVIKAYRRSLKRFYRDVLEFKYFDTEGPQPS